MDTDNSGTIEIIEAHKYWQNNYAKLNAYEMFEQIDKDQNGEIDMNEWLEFWENVLKTGTSPAALSIEVIRFRLIFIFIIIH